MTNDNFEIYSKVVKGINVRHSLSVGIDYTSTLQLNIAIVGDLPPVVELSKFINDKMGIPYVREVGGYGLPSNHKKDDNHKFSDFIDVEVFGQGSNAYDEMVIIEYNKVTNTIVQIEQGEVTADERWTTSSFHRFIKNKREQEDKASPVEEILRLIDEMDPEMRMETMRGLI